MSKNIVFFDLETTGIDVTVDRIVEIYMAKYTEDGQFIDELYSKINPYPVKVSKEAHEVHGLSNESLMNEPKFSDVAYDILNFIEDCSLAGFNLVHFDIPLLFEEFYRNGILHNFKKYDIFDCYRIWLKYEKRTLSAAVKRFLGKDHMNAHQAKADVKMTAEVFQKQLKEYSNFYTDLSSLSKDTCDLNRYLDFSGKFEKTNDGVILTIGKHKNKNIELIAKEDLNYFKWMSESNFSTDTKLIAKKIYETYQ